MSGWDRFADTFLNTAVMAKYLPAIIDGFFLTVGLAALVVVTGIAAGLVLALLRSLGVRPLNWLIIFVVDLFRAAAAGGDRAAVFRPALGRLLA